MNYLIKKTNQPFLFKSKKDLDGKLVETITPIKDIEAFENYLESIDEHYDESLQSSKKQKFSLKPIKNI